MWLYSTSHKRSLIVWSKHLGKSVAQNKSTCPWTPKLSTLGHGHQMDGWPLRARLCTGGHPEISLWQILCNLYKTALDEAIYIYTQGLPAHAKRSHAQVKDPVVHVKVRWIMETPIWPSMHWKWQASSECWSWTLYGRRRSIQSHSNHQILQINSAPQCYGSLKPQCCQTERFP